MGSCLGRRGTLGFAFTLRFCNSSVKAFILSMMSRLAIYAHFSVTATPSIDQYRQYIAIREKKQ